MSFSEIHILLMLKLYQVKNGIFMTNTQGKSDKTRCKYKNIQS